VRTQLNNRVAFDYRKNNPWGVLSASYSASLTNEEYMGETSKGIVIDELYTFNDPFPVELNRINVDISDIYVTDITGMEVYTENDDYTITVVNGRVILKFTTLGYFFPNVEDGQELYISYTFSTEPDRKEDSLLQRFRITQQFTNGLSAYYFHGRRDEQISSSSIISSVPDEYRTNSFGLEYDHEGLRLNTEYTLVESTHGPSDRARLGGRYTWLINNESSLVFHASQNWLDIGGLLPRKTTLFNTGGTFLSQLTKNMGISAGTEWRNEDDSRIGRTMGFRFNSKLKYDYRLFSVEIGGEYYILNRLKTENNNTNVYFRVSRRF